MKEKIYYIYMLPHKIGCTDNIKRRMQRYGYSEQFPLILETHTDIKLAAIRERELQEFYGYKKDKNIYNHTDEMRKKLSDSLKGNRNAKDSVRSEEVRDKISKSLKGVPFTEERLSNLEIKIAKRKKESPESFNKNNDSEKRSIAAKKVVWTQERRDRQSARMKGQPSNLNKKKK